MLFDASKPISWEFPRKIRQAKINKRWIINSQTSAIACYQTQQNPKKMKESTKFYFQLQRIRHIITTRNHSKNLPCPQNLWIQRTNIMNLLLVTRIKNREKERKRKNLNFNRIGSISRFQEFEKNVSSCTRHTELFDETPRIVFEFEVERRFFRFPSFITLSFLFEKQFPFPFVHIVVDFGFLNVNRFYHNQKTEFQMNERMSGWVDLDNHTMLFEDDEWKYYHETQKEAHHKEEIPS